VGSIWEADSGNISSGGGATLLGGVNKDGGLHDDHEGMWKKYRKEKIAVLRLAI